MCKKCNGEMKLVGYKWDREENLIIYRYWCNDCGEEVTKCGILSDRQLKDQLVDEEAYSKFNL